MRYLLFSLLVLCPFLLAAQADTISFNKQYAGKKRSYRKDI